MNIELTEEQREQNRDVIRAVRTWVAEHKQEHFENVHKEIQNILLYMPEEELKKAEDDAVALMAVATQNVLADLCDRYKRGELT